MKKKISVFGVVLATLIMLSIPVVNTVNAEVVQKTYEQKNTDYKEKILDKVKNLDINKEKLEQIIGNLKLNDIGEIIAFIIIALLSVPAFIVGVITWIPAMIFSLILGLITGLINAPFEGLSALIIYPIMCFLFWGVPWPFWAVLIFWNI